jgi:4-hydroxythreonine-4-phosphate dehydrogenase
MMPARLAVTPGEPAGIGPDLLIEAAQEPWPVQLVGVCSANLIRERARQLGKHIEIRKFDPATEPHPAEAGVLYLVDIPLAEEATAGRLSKANAGYVLQCLEEATSGCLTGTFSGLVTGPVQKSIINEAGIRFSGHTEFLAERSGTSKVVMMLATSRLRVALVTTHLPLHEVPKAITQEEVTLSLTILHRELIEKFGLANPRILVCGLNPHAGEGGHLGNEEIDIIQPALESARQQGMQIHGPLPADSLFTPAVLKTGDAVLAMYHDQGLGPFKALSFGESVNVTLGLPFVRTSVDHGTALDLAGTGRASVSSLKAAIEMAKQLCTSSYA